MAKVKYIKLSDAIKALRNVRKEIEREFDECGGEAGIYAEAYEDAARLMHLLSTVQMEETGN